VARTPVGEARRRTCGGGESGDEPLVREESGEGTVGASGRSLEVVGWWAPVLKVVLCKRRCPCSDFGSGRSC